MQARLSRALHKEYARALTMGRLRRPRRHRKRYGAIATAACKKKVDLTPEDCDIQPLPRKLRLLMDTSKTSNKQRKASATTKPNSVVLDIKSSDVIDETRVETDLPSSTMVHTASAARKKHLKQWKEKHKKRRQRKEDTSSHDHIDKISFGEVTSRPPELSGRRVKLKHLTFMQTQANA